MIEPKIYLAAMFKILVTFYHISILQADQYARRSQGLYAPLQPFHRLKIKNVYGQFFFRALWLSTAVTCHFICDFDIKWNYS